jgi:hypothetical protein
MAEHRHVPEPGELTYRPQPSWAPAIFAFGILGLVCGTFASGFIFAPYIYGVIGAVIALLAFRGLVRGATRDYYRLPRRQRVRSAALPIETITVSPKP